MSELPKCFATNPGPQDRAERECQYCSVRLRCIPEHYDRSLREEYQSDTAFATVAAYMLVVAIAAFIGLSVYILVVTT